MSESAESQRDRLLDVLEAVMEQLRTVGGSPAEHQAFSSAFAELAKHGRGPLARDRAAMDLAYAEWEIRVARREKQRICPHPMWDDKDGESRPHCAECGKGWPG